MSSIPYLTPNVHHDLPFADQRGGLKAMGVVLIVLGAFMGCLAAFIPMTLLAPRPPGTIGPTPRDLVGGILVYALGAGVLMTAGVGSLRGKRWSRPMVLVVTGSAALMGIIGLVSWLFVGPDLERAMANATAAGAGGPTGAAGTPAPAAVPAGMARTIMAVTAVMMFVFLVLLPGGFFWFYVRDSVRRTLEYFDPFPAWTDRCPTPVLALSAWLALAALFTLNFCLWGVFPFFGRLLSGAVAVGLLGGTALLLAILAVGTYRLSRLAWLGTALFVILAAASGLLTFSRVDPLEIHRLSGTPPEQVRMMEQMELTTGKTMLFSTSLYALGALAYLAWVYRYFRRGRTVAATPEVATWPPMPPPAAGGNGAGRI